MIISDLRAAQQLQTGTSATVLDATRALQACGGDPERALKLLARNGHDISRKRALVRNPHESELTVVMRQVFGQRFGRRFVETNGWFSAHLGGRALEGGFHHGALQLSLELGFIDPFQNSELLEQKIQELSETMELVLADQDGVLVLTALEHPGVDAERVQELLDELTMATRSPKVQTLYREIRQKGSR